MVPKVSVVIPVYNGSRFLPEAVESIAVQGFPDTEVVIIDDGSTDETPVVARKMISAYRDRLAVSYQRQENQGPSAARNAGILRAVGDVIAFLDADDLYPPEKFKVQLAAFDDDPSLDLVAGRIQYISLEGAEEREVKYDEDNAVVHVHLGSMLVRRHVFDTIGLFDAAMRYSEDIEWWLRVREKPLHFVILHDITLQYRLHDSNMTRGLTGIEKPFMDALHRSLARRRETGQMHLKPMSDARKDTDQ